MEEDSNWRWRGVHETQYIIKVYVVSKVNIEEEQQKQFKEYGSTRW